MAKKREPSKVTTFRTSQRTHKFLGLVAEAKGIDLSALINLIISDAIPDLREWYEDHLESVEPSDREEMQARIDKLEREIAARNGQ
jgi:hypothetical protein